LYFLLPAADPFKLALLQVYEAEPEFMPLLGALLELPFWNRLKDCQGAIFPEFEEHPGNVAFVAIMPFSGTKQITSLQSN
jgi:hypothetical protein